MSICSCTFATGLTMTATPASPFPASQNPNQSRAKFRFGVTFRLLIAFAVVTAFAILLGTVALFTFGKYESGFNRIASTNLPALVAASDLAQRSQALSANAPNLAVVDGHFARRAVSEALRDQLQAITKISQHITKLAPTTEGLDNLDRNEASLKESLEKLDRLVPDKLESDRVAANFMLRLGMLSNRVRAAGNDALPRTSDEPSSRVQIDALATWTAAADQAIIIMLSTSNADTVVRLSRLRSDFAEAGNRQRAAREYLSPALIQAIDPLERTLAQFGRGSPNIFDVRAAQLASTSAVRGALLDTKEASSRFVESADRVFADVQKDARAQSDYFSGMIVNYSRVFTILSLLCLVSAGAVFLYLNRSVISRLQKLSENMRRSADGAAAPILISGNDEIADMARAADFFATSLVQREQGLRESVAELRALGEVTQAVNSSVDLETVLTTIVTKATQLSGTEAGAIYVFDDTNDEFQLRATYGLSESIVAELRRSRIRLGQTGVSEAVERRAPIQVPDIQSDPTITLDVIIRAGFRAILYVPMLGAEKIVGALVVRRKQPGEFSKSSIELLQTFAAQSVLAIQNAWLFSEIAEKGRQLAEASQHKSHFLASMSHELRTPLNAILGYTELIADGIYGTPPEKMQTVLKRVESNGRHLLGLINAVLDLSKIEAGQLTLDLADYSLQNVAQTVYNAVEPLAADKRLAFKADMQPDLPPGRGDERRLTQVLLNLVGNAIKFTDTGEVVIRAGASNGDFHLSVRDTGPGISAADQAKLFQQFQQADNPETRKKEGTGLGLAISKRIVEMHGGRIWMESQLGQGSTFFVTLPVQVAEQAKSSN
jgi:signal transduction histidine kinase